MSRISLEERARSADRVTIIGSIINALLIVIKLACGIIARSTAMIADSVHSLSDFATDIVVLIGMNISKKPLDSDHNYGHGKFETFSSLIIALVLIGAAIGIGYTAVLSIIDFVGGKQLPPPRLIVLIAAIISVITKELMYRMTIVTAKRINSRALIANAWHHRSDALSSVAVAIGVGAALILNEKWRVIDPILGVLIAIILIKTAIDIAKDAVNELLECSVNEDEKEILMKIIRKTNGVADPHNLKTRRIGSTIAVDVHIRVNPDLTVLESHTIATAVENGIKDEFGENSFVSVHVEPDTLTD